MKRSWIGLALLSTSWLFGLSYYHNAALLIWAILIVAGTGLLIGERLDKPASFQAMLAVFLSIPAICLAPWPYRAVPLLFAVGLAIFVAPIPRRWPKVVASAPVLAGVVLLIQSLSILVYESITAKTHELPRPLPDLLYAFSRILGIKSVFNGSNLALYSPRAVHLLGTTWELLLDPVTLSFLAGGIVMLCIRAHTNQEKTGRKLYLTKKVASLVIIIAAWLPFRAAILIAILMHRALRTEYEETLVLVNQFWNPWLYLFLLLGPIILILRFVHKSPGIPHSSSSDSGTGISKPLGVIALSFAGSLMLIVGLFMDMPGRQKPGRVIVDEYHSDWEPTERPFDTNWYGNDSGYNYACIYDYCSRFYEMSRLNNQIDDAALKNCDVLMVKVPTSRYSPDEIAAIERFVESGGGLLLIGEHTNVFKTGTYINDIAEIFGFRFRYDCLFDIDTIFTQRFDLPLIPHPIIQNMPPLNFAVSCSLSPGKSLGRAVIRSTGMKNLPADYHASNYYPQVEDRTDMRYGAFTQLWATRHGGGRVVAFTDSTIFSNFATFEPGKTQLMLGMLEWLNHRNFSLDIRPFLVLMGLISLIGAAILSRNLNSAGIIIIGAGLFGWAMGVVGTRVINQYSMPLPQARRSMVRVVMDRTVCDAPLPISGFTSGQKNGFGLFERWILRLGYFTSRRSGSDALTGDLIVFTHPNLTVKNEFREELVDYVKSGGKVLVLDSPENSASTANSLLYPFGMAINHRIQVNGQLRAPDNWPVINIDSACAIEGGTPMLRATNTPITARVDFGKGTVTAIGFGSKFADAYMGITGDTVPSQQLRNVYEVEFQLIKDIISGQQ
ncbi:MAG: hypothetical protein JW715_11935 [Sedimentisphaerales bacterium]|nr:hypothetical protein [Sedimentisphaerales bacterium]